MRYNLVFAIHFPLILLSLYHVSEKKQFLRLKEDSSIKLNYFHDFF
jgi:hypothetical protein